MNKRVLELCKRYKERMLLTDLPPAPADTLLCPLCWNELPFAQFSPDHFIPQAIGGRRSDFVPTCTECNNKHGTKLDAQLAGYQDDVGAVRGAGAISTGLTINGSKMVADLTMSHSGHKFNVIAKASNPAEVAAIKAAFEEKRVQEFDFGFRSRYTKNGFNVALLRAAYLTLFSQFGYGYLKHEIVQQIRRRIADPRMPHPDLTTMIMELRNYRGPDVPFSIHAGKVNEAVPFYFVIIRARRKMTSYLGVFMPWPSEFDHEFFPMMAECKAAFHGASFSFPAAN